jgi:alpha-L-rhamnosidase
VRIVAEMSPQRHVRPDGALQLDGGQNIAGFVRLRVRGRAGTEVSVRHAEVLEADGSLHTVSLRSARATDTYVLADDEETILEPRQTFHGFRYAEVATDAEVLDATFVAISIHLSGPG